MSKISHHPSDEMLMSHIKGDLPESISIAVAAHAQLCAGCQAKLDQFTMMIAEKELMIDEKALMIDEKAFDSILEGILGEEPELSFLMVPPPTSIEINKCTYLLPTALSHYQQAKWRQLGSISRARVLEEPSDIRASLLHISAGGSIPHHAHKGFEINLVLAGGFEDEYGVYQAGDFIYLDAKHQHSPVTKTGCLCYAVQNAPLHFTSGMSKMLNPIGHLLY